MTNPFGRRRIVIVGVDRVTGNARPADAPGGYVTASRRSATR